MSASKVSNLVFLSLDFTENNFTFTYLHPSLGEAHANQHIWVAVYEKEPPTRKPRVSF